MPTLAAWSSDWSAQPVPDLERSAITGKQEFLKDKKQLVYGGTYYMRLAMPTMELGKHGYNSFLSWNLNVKPSGEFVCMDPQGDWHEPDIVWLQRHMGDGMDVAIERAKACGQIVINDLDDQFWNLPKTNQAYESTNPITHPTFNRDHYRKAIAASSAITVSTPALAKEMERLGPPVFLCRNMIDIERWPQLDPVSDGYISWVGGIAWRANDMFVLKQFLPNFLEDLGLPFYHGGDSQVPGVPKAWDQIGIDTTIVQCATQPLCSIQDYPKLWEPINVSLIPLEDVKFNHAKCIELSMRVITIDGVTEIRNLSVGDHIWSVNGWVPVEAIELQPRQQGIELRTKQGRVLRVSDNHRMWVNDQWLPAREIQEGDKLSTVPGGKTDISEYVVAPWPADSRVSRGSDRSMDFLTATDGPKVVINERWGRFLGLFIGDGCASQQTAISISCDGQDADLIGLIMEDIESFGLHAGTEHVKTWGGEILRRRSVRVSSANLMRFMFGIGFVEWDGGNVRNGKHGKVFAIPEIIWRSPASVQSAFLAGLFEADGTCGRPSVSFTSKSERLTRDVQLMLTTFGVETFINESWRTAKKDNPKRFQSFTLRTRRAGADVFEKEIGFLSQRKREKLADVTSRSHSNAYKPTIWVDSIVSVTPVEIDTVDIQVENSEFVVEGLRTHNSALKALESSACGLPYIASDLPEQRWFTEDGGMGRLAKNWKPKTWENHLMELLDPEVRRIEGQANREHAEKFDIANNWQQWDRVFRELGAVPDSVDDMVAA